jgi:hypothetical protein
MADAPTLIGWERAFMAAEKVKERLRRAIKAIPSIWMTLRLKIEQSVMERVHTGRVADA